MRVTRPRSDGGRRSGEAPQDARAAYRSLPQEANLVASCAPSTDPVQSSTPSVPGTAAAGATERRETQHAWRDRERRAAADQPVQPDPTSHVNEDRAPVTWS